MNFLKILGLAMFAVVCVAITVLGNKPDIYRSTYGATAPRSVNDPDFERQYHHGLIQTLRAWELLEEKQTSTVRVGIIDAGICGAHQDLVNMLDENLHGFRARLLLRKTLW
jgi:hypothetical protein